MIKLTKGQIPEILAENAATWTQQICDALASGRDTSTTLRTRYNNPAVKEAIIDETHGKCAYCESKVRHVTHGDIEHIIPKSKRPELWFEWANLTLACPKCNLSKSNHEGIIDPYQMEPNEHFWFVGSMIFASPNSDIGTFSEAILNLNRSDLLDRRVERLKNLERIVKTANQQNNLQTRFAILEDLLNNEIGDNVEYAGMCRAFVALAKTKGLVH